MADRLILLCFVFVLILVPLRSSATEMIFLDVGQGDGIYIHDGYDYLIDAGSSSDKELGKYTLEPFLKSRAVGSLEKVFVTHADSDHISAIVFLLKESDIVIRELLLPACAADDGSCDELMALAAAHNTGISFLSAGDTVAAKYGTFTCMYPHDNVIFGDLNDRSMVLLYQRGDFSVLFMGDAGKEAEKDMLKQLRKDRSFPVTVLKAGHHGSSSSTSDELLDYFTPGCAILSYGKNNRYGHPGIETVDKLKDHNIKIYRTAQLGGIAIKVYDGRYTAQGYVDQIPVTD